MKKIVSVSLGPRRFDYEFETKLWGADFHIRRVGTEGDIGAARRLVGEHDGQVDCIALGGMSIVFDIGGKRWVHKETLSIARKARTTPVVGGRGLKKIIDRWAVREIARRRPDLFADRNALFLSGIAQWDLARVMGEFTDTLRFADPVLHFGAPWVLPDEAALKVYARAAMPLLTRRPYVSFFPSGRAAEGIQQGLLNRHFQRADVVVGDLRQLLHYAPRDLSHLVVVTDTVDDTALDLFRSRGVETLCTTAPQVFGGERHTSLEVLHALCVAHLDKPSEQIEDGDYLRLLTELKARPRIIHPQGEQKTRRKFAYLYYPPGRRDLFRDPRVRWLREAPPGVQAVAERVASRLPITARYRVRGIESPTGAEADGWILYLPATAKQIKERGPAYAVRRLEEATRLASRLGVQILGVGGFSRTMTEATHTVAARTSVPITSGTSYLVSASMWAAKRAILRLGVEQDEVGRAIATALVVGAGDGEGSVAAELLALVFHRVVLVDREPDRLLELTDRIAVRSPHCTVEAATRVEPHLEDAHLVVTGLAPGWEGGVDIQRLRPGSVLVDCGRPSEFGLRAAESRPDVLIVHAGELELPGPADLGGNLGPPPKVAFASLAETVVLTLEDRFECFSLGADVRLDRVKEMYRLGLRHGLELGSIRGVRGPIGDSDIALVREHAEQVRRRANRPPPLETTADEPSPEPEA